MTDAGRRKDKNQVLVLLTQVVAEGAVTIMVKKTWEL